MSYPKTMPARAMVGRRVVNEWGIDLGRIEDVAIDVEQGRVMYIALAFRSAGMTCSKLFAVPWDSLTFHPESGEFILDVPRDLLEEAAGFDDAHWPEIADVNWGMQVYTQASTSFQTQ